MRNTKKSQTFKHKTQKENNQIDTKPNKTCGITAKSFLLAMDENK